MENDVMTSSRIEYIDFAKGLAILLVIYDHVFYYYTGTIDVWHDLVKTIHIPTFFILSGYLLKDKKTVSEYLKGKINTLLVPFFAFWLILGNLIPVVFSAMGSNTYSQWNLDCLLFGIWNEEMLEGPLWFLWALFWVSSFYYILYKAVFKSSTHVIIPIALLVGLIGVGLGTHQISLPLYLDSILTAFLFYGMGHLFAKCNLFEKIAVQKRWILIVAVCGILFTKMLVGDNSYVSNEFHSTVSRMLFCSILGSLSIILLSIGINRNRMINFLGKNSLVLVCIHLFIMRILIKVEGLFLPEKDLLFLSILLIATIIISSLFIPLLNKVAPAILGKKPLLK